jgi:hypothetical protein
LDITNILILETAFTVAEIVFPHPYEHIRKSQIPSLIHIAKKPLSPEQN